MTKYQEIKQELISLGWTERQGKGDHMVFEKKGLSKKIAVPVSLSETKRTYSNIISQIRQLDPTFTLGLPTKKKNTKEENTTVKTPEGIPYWAAYSMPIRWTAPENKDYKKLSDSGSLMNKEYHVKDFVTGNGKTKIIIADEECEFQVSLEDIDAWDTMQCPNCNEIKPANRFLDFADDYYCKECVTKFIELKKKEQEEKKKNTKLAIEDNKLAVSSELEDWLEQYKDIRYSDLTPEERQKFKEEFKRKIPSKIRKLMLRDRPDMAFLFMDEEETIPTPFQAWKSFINKTCDSYVFEHYPDYESERKHKLLRQRFHSTSYRIQKLKGEDGSLDILEITTKDWEVMLFIWKYSCALVEDFIKIFPRETSNFVILLNCPSVGFKQYITDYWDKDRRNRTYALLESIVGKKEPETLSRARLDQSLPNGIDFIKNLTDVLKELNIEITTDIFSYYFFINVREEDEQKLETAKTFFKYIIKIKSNTPDKEDYKRFKSALKEKAALERWKKPIKAILITDSEDEAEISHQNEDNPEKIIDFFPEGYFEDISNKNSEDDSITEYKLFGINKGEILMSIEIDKEDPNAYHIIMKDGDQNMQNEQIRILSAITYDILNKNVNNKSLKITQKSLLKGIKKFKNDFKDEPEKTKELDKIFADINPKKQITMETNFLDLTNPTSSDITCSNLTTRQLLRELKERGISFDNLTITIKKKIDINSI